MQKTFLPWTFVVLILLISLLLGPATTPAQAATIAVGPSDCSAAAVNAAISASTTLDGDTVLLTCTGSISWAATGTHSWSTSDSSSATYAINIPATKGITLQVQGASNANKSSPTFPLTITLPSNVQAIVANIGANNSVTRISGFKFQNSGNVDGFISVVGAGVGKGPNYYGGYRVDNNYFNGIAVWDGVVSIWAGRNGTTGNLFGLTDNNTFYNTYNSANPTYGPYNIQIWNWWHPASPSGNLCFGCDGWTNNDFVYGGGNQNFIEDNLFDQEASASGHMRHYINAELGARYVSRHNTFVNNFGDTNADLMDAHGLCGIATNGVGNRGGEIYANTISGTGFNRTTVLRGGSWLVYDNTITSGHSIELMEYRSEASSASECSTTDPLGVMPPWTVPAGAAWNPNAPWVSDVTNATNFPPSTYHPLPQQIFNTYAWNNKTSGGATINPTVANDGTQTSYIVAGTDYFASASKPAALASYTAYTYPHPLQGGGSGGSAPNPPSGLTAIVQ